MKKYFLKTFGCQMNFSDSERIESFLKSNGFTQSLSSDRADLVIFNTCGVRQTAEDRVYGAVHNIRKVKSQSASGRTKIKIIITGCLAHRKDVQRKMKNKVDLFVPIKDFFTLSFSPEQQRKTYEPSQENQSSTELFDIENWNFENCLKIKNYKLKISARKQKIAEDNYLSLKPKYRYKNKISVPIMSGCNNFCSYCVVPYARGREWSRSPEEIFQEIKSAHQNGCQEVLLLGQNVNSYQFEIRNLKLEIDSKFKIQSASWRTKFKRQTNNDIIDFPLLLNTLAKAYPKITWRFLTSHPKDFSDELIQIIAENKNISKEIHLPLQSGSDKVLKDMNRPYTQKKYLNLIEKIKKTVPDVELTTDIIIGFPTETEKEFLETKKVIEKADFADAYLNKYSPRFGTTAEKLGNPISWEEKKRREKILRSCLKKNLTLLPEK